MQANHFKSVKRNALAMKAQKCLIEICENIVNAA